MTRPTVVTGSIWRPFLDGEEGEDEPGEERVHRDPGQDHDHPLPDRLGLEEPVERDLGVSVAPPSSALLADVLLPTGHLDVAAERQPGDRRIRSRPASEGQPGNRRAQPEREAMDVDARPLGGEEVPGLVDEDEHAEHDDQRKHGVSTWTSSSAARWRAPRAHRSASRTAPRLRRRAGVCASSTARSLSLIRPKGMRPARNAATATSLAALNTAGAVPPARPAAMPAREGAEHVPAHRLEGERPRRDRIEPADTGVGESLGMGERVQDRQLHRWEAELGDHAAVAELDERVDDALRDGPPPRARRRTARRDDGPRSPRAPCWPASRCPP